MLNKLYEDNALGTIPQDRYEQMSKKYSEEYYALKAELATLQEQLSAYENAGGRTQKFLKLTERHAAFTELTPAILNEFISRIEVHERDQKRARYAIQHISIYFNYTPATRAAIIEKLVAAGFVERKGRSLIPTKAGINLVTVLPEPLTSPMLTAEWEQKLTEIAKGSADPDTFMDGIRTMVQEIVSTYGKWDPGVCGQS